MRCLEGGAGEEVERAAWVSLAKREINNNNERRKEARHLAMEKKEKERGTDPSASKLLAVEKKDRPAETGRRTATGSSGSSLQTRPAAVFQRPRAANLWKGHPLLNLPAKKKGLRQTKQEIDAPLPAGGACCRLQKKRTVQRKKAKALPPGLENE